MVAFRSAKERSFAAKDDQMRHLLIGQHLAAADAYRSDRRKDAMLQEHDYFVLRFLTEDVGTGLDAVLDAILHALSHRGAKDKEEIGLLPA